MIRILLVGGGSGGHVYPVIAIANALKNQGDLPAASAAQTGVELMLLGDNKFMGQAARESGIKFRSIMSGKFRRYFSSMNLLDIFKFPVGLFQSLWHIFWFMPDAVFAKGGYVSVLPALVAKLYLIPLYIHESDSVPGLANRMIGRMAKTVFISFKSAEKYFKIGKSVLVGNPIRKELLNADRNTSIQAFGLDAGKQTVLIIGGSQGAQKINDIVLDSLVIMAGRFQVIHQCGQGQYNAVKLEVDRITKEGEGKYADSISRNYKLFPFFDSKQMAAAYAAADVIISRAGAGSIFEIAEVGKPAILIPITNSSGDHQLANARDFSGFGAVVIEEENLTSHILLNQIESLLEPVKYQEVSQKIKSFALSDAADKIAAILLQQ